MKIGPNRCTSSSTRSGGIGAAPYPIVVSVGDVVARDAGLQHAEQHGRNEVRVGRACAPHLRGERDGIEAAAVLEPDGAPDDKQRQQRDLHARVVR